MDNQDPWRNRTQGMKCSTCMWFVPKGDTQLGRCRRHAPTMSGFPAVYMTDWCGDHKLDESTVAIAPGKGPNKPAEPSISEQMLRSLEPNHRDMDRRTA